jgi:CRP-like cAMP-binding protein
MKFYSQNKTININFLKRGQSFGEIALSKGVNKRNATIIAKCYCEFAILNKADYQQILGDLEDI